MSKIASEEDDLPRILAQAFARVWERYLRDDTGRVSEEIARSSLKEHLVSMAKEGVKDERSLMAGGLMHLMWLGDAPPRSSGFLSKDSDTDTLAPLSEVVTFPLTHFHFRVDSANAKFLRQYRLPSPVFQISADALRTS